MKTIQKTAFGLSLMLLATSCSVQQFAVNTSVAPFQNCGRACGEDTEGKEFKKSKDIFFLGFNVKHSDTKTMAEELNAKSYTIETKTNYLLNIITCGFMDYKVVKVIKRDN